MQFFPNFSTFLSIGGFEIKWYAIFIITGAYIAYRLTQRTVSKWGYPDNFLEDWFVYVLLIGIAGARLWYVIFEWRQYIDHPIGIITDFREGGLAIQGGLIAGAIFSYYYFKKRNVSFLRIFDAAMPHVLLAQAFGRWGNFFNHEAYGGIVSESFYNHFPNFIKNNMYIAGEFRQPTFLFESVANLIGWVLILTLFKKYLWRKRGDMGFAYLVWYGITRFFIEGLRTDSLYMFGFIRTAQLISIIFVIVGLMGYFGLFSKVFKNTLIFKKNKPVVIFDLDGTLLNTHELINQSYIATLKKYRPDYVVTQEDIDGFAGPTLEQTFSRFSEDKKEIDEMIIYYRKWNHENHDAYVTEIDGVTQTLQWLKDNDYKMAVVSNKPQESIALGIDLYDIRKYFDVIIGCYDVDEPKPSPKGLIKACEEMGVGHDDVIYVGDAVTDIQACKNMGAYSVAFILEKKYEASMKEEKPCKMIYNMNELINLVKEDLEWSDSTIL